MDAVRLLFRVRCRQQDIDTSTMSWARESTGVVSYALEHISCESVLVTYRVLENIYIEIAISLLT